MIVLRDRNWPLDLMLIGIAALLVYLGRHHIMQIYYNYFLLSLGALSVCVVLMAWAIGGAQDSINNDGLGKSEIEVDQ